MECPFSTCERTKVAQTPQCLKLLTWKCASRHNSVHFFHIKTSKSVPNHQFLTLLSWKCVSRHNSLYFCNISSQLPKVAQPWCALCILTWKWDNSVHFFDISTSKSGLNVVCFVDLEICFVPQRRAVFYLSSGQLARTRRFSEPTFRPPRATNHGKTVNREFPTCSCTCIFFLRSLSLLWSSHFFSSPLWLFPPLLFHLSILSEVWLLHFLRSMYTCVIQRYTSSSVALPFRLPPRPRSSVAWLWLSSIRAAGISASALLRRCSSHWPERPVRSRWKPHGNGIKMEERTHL